MNTPIMEAQELLEHGYIPLRVPYGEKAAKQPGWATMLPNKESIARDFSRRSNLGVRCGDLQSDGTRLMAIDIDVDESDLVRCVEQAVGTIVPTKKGKKGATLFVRVDYEQKTTKLRQNLNGKKEPAIDILCLGAQSVVPPSTHPETKMPYRWIAGKPLHEVDYKTLPVFGPGLVDEIRGFLLNPDDPIYALNDMVWKGVGGGGDTHDTCVSAVMSMVRRDWTEAEIHERINRAKSLACEYAGLPFNWPKSQKTIQEWIDSARAKIGTTPKKSQRLSHGVVADTFLPQARDHFRYDRERACWYFFDGVCWREKSDYRLRHALDMFLSGELRNSPMISGTEKSLRDRPEFSMKQSDWDPDFHLFNTPAGTVDLKSGTVRPQLPADLITRCSAISPAESSEGSLWVSKLPEWFGDDPEELRYIQKLCGLFLIGGNPEACLPLWIGPGGDGKSVISNTLRHIMGDYARTSTDTAFLDNRHGQHHEEIAWLKGARLVLVNEINGSLAWNDARIKSVTGGESQSASFKGGHLFEFQPEFKLLITGNEAPSLRSVGPEFRRRFHVLKFIRGVAAPDPYLTEKLKAEAGAVLRWMIDGAALYYKEGLTPSPAVKSATAEYFEENDTIQQWLNESTESGEEFRTKGETGYANYRAWAAAQGFNYPLTRPKLTSKLKAKGIICKTGTVKGETAPVRCYFGIRIVVEHDVTARFGEF
ncbi:phage/plasmid primase, P4 family [Erythrobacter sp.]|nr:phage/plasmid primase, P4 family [Erythrobacter sp.]